MRKLFLIFMFFPGLVFSQTQENTPMKKHLSLTDEVQFHVKGQVVGIDSNVTFKQIDSAVIANTTALHPKDTVTRFQVVTRKTTDSLYIKSLSGALLKSDTVNRQKVVTRKSCDSLYATRKNIHDSLINNYLVSSKKIKINERITLSQLNVGADSNKTIQQNSFCFVLPAYNKVRSSYAQSTDTSCVFLNWTPTGKPNFQIKSQIGSSIFQIDTLKACTIAGGLSVAGSSTLATVTAQSLNCYSLINNIAANQMTFSSILGMNYTNVNGSVLFFNVNKTGKFTQGNNDTSFFHSIIPFTKQGVPMNNALNITYKTINKNTSSVTQSTDTSSCNLIFSQYTGKPQFTIKDETGFNLLNVDSTKKVNLSYTVLRAGTSTSGTASLKMNKSVLLLTPEIGAVERDNKNIYVTDDTTQRQTLVQAGFAGLSGAFTTANLASLTQVTGLASMSSKYITCTDSVMKVLTGGDGTYDARINVSFTPNSNLLGNTYYFNLYKNNTIIAQGYANQQGGTAVTNEISANDETLVALNTNDKIRCKITAGNFGQSLQIDKISIVLIRLNR